MQVLYQMKEKPHHLKINEPTIISLTSETIS